MTRFPSSLALFFILLALCGCAGSSGAPATAIAQPEIAAAYLPLHGRVHLGIDSANGAAVVIAPGIAVTNEHNENLVARKTILGFGSASDLMFFRTVRAVTPPVAMPVVGEVVTAYGQGADAELRIAHGVVCNIVKVPGHADSPYFLFEGNAGPGFSGGPVLNKDGHLIGITWGYVDRGKKRLMFAYDMARVRAEFKLKRPVKSVSDGRSAPVPAYGGCDRKS